MVIQIIIFYKILLCCHYDVLIVWHLDLFLTETQVTRLICIQNTYWVFEIHLYSCMARDLLKKYQTVYPL